MEFRVDQFLNAVIYAALGIVIYIVAFIVVDMATPGELGTEIFQKHNMAAAVFVGFLMLGISIIIAASVH